MGGVIGFKLNEYEFYADYTCKNPSNPTVDFELRGDYPPEINYEKHKAVSVNGTARSTVVRRIKDTMAAIGYDIENMVKSEYMMEVIIENYE